MTTNEARHPFLSDLSGRMGWGVADPRYRVTEKQFLEALADERRDTVERIRAATAYDVRITSKDLGWDSEPVLSRTNLDRILDREAAR